VRSRSFKNRLEECSRRGRGAAMEPTEGQTAEVKCVGGPSEGSTR